MRLSLGEGAGQRLYSVSREIQKERKAYYSVLEETQKGTLEVTPWMEWYLDRIKSGVRTSLESLSLTLELKEFWARISSYPLNFRQKKILELVTGDFQGPLTSSKWAKICHCSQDTAERDIAQLKDWSILVRGSKGGRSTAWELLNPPKHLLQNRELD